MVDIGFDGTWCCDCLMFACGWASSREVMVWNGRVVEAIEIEKKFWKGGRAFMGLIFSIDNQGVKHAAAYVDKRNRSLGGAKGGIENQSDRTR
jgi:hypothetical protein